MIIEKYAHLFWSLKSLWSNCVDVANELKETATHKTIFLDHKLNILFVFSLIF